MEPHHGVRGVSRGLRRRGPRVLAKGAWATLVAVTVWLTTTRLGASFHVGGQS